MSSDPISPSLGISIIAALMLLHALIILCNTAFSNVSLNRVLIPNSAGKDKKGILVEKILQKPFRCRYTNRIVNYACIIAGAVIVLLMPCRIYVGLPVYFAVLLILGELFPRKLAIQHSDIIVYKFSGFQNFILIVFYPIIIISKFFTDIVLKIFRQNTKIEINRFSEEDVMSMLEAGQQSGDIKEEGKKMINSIFEFDDELAYEIMTPRTDVFLIDLDDPAEEYMDQLMELRYSRIPVCEGESDNIIGILHIKDYLIKAREDGFENVDIKSILRKPYLVPETKNIDSLFFELQKERQHIAILIDEYGGFSGIVTMEDIIEEVMGEIDDEYDEEEFSLHKVDDSTYIINGKANLDDLNEKLNIDLESDNSETLGGFLIDLLGEIPTEDETDRVIKFKNFEFTILSVKDRRIESIKMSILPEQEEDMEDEEQ